MGKGKLLFKGDKPKKKKKKSKHSSSSVEAESVLPPTNSNPQVKQSKASNSKASASSSVVPPHMKQGTGTITTSGTVVYGDSTKFEKEISIGDAILCSVNGQDELRVVTMRISNQSLNLSTPFSTNLKTPTEFHYIRKPRDAQQEKRDSQKKLETTQKEQQTHAFDLYGSETLVYRERTENGSYRIKHESIDSRDQTRGDLLIKRSKKTSDKYC